MFPKLIGFLVISMLVTTSTQNAREKRLVYFTNGGTFKLVIGFAIPIKLGLKQSMAWGWNFQFQYAEPQTPNDTMVYPPIVGRRSKRTKRNVELSDRGITYAAIEALLNRNGSDGRSCLLQDICFNALYNLHHEANGLYGHLLHIALTPDYGEGVNDPNLDPEYLDARKAGEFGVDCRSMYPGCQSGHGLLDQISLIDDSVHFDYD